MNHIRSDADATVADDKIYIVGGFDGNNCISTVEMYDPSQDRWFMLPSMSISRSGVSCISHRGYIYALGKLEGSTKVSIVWQSDALIIPRYLKQRPPTCYVDTMTGSLSYLVEHYSFHFTPYNLSLIHI